MTTQRPRTTSRTSDHVGLPPPLALELRDADRLVGWVRGHAIGFRGFESALEAVHAAWVAHRTLARRVAQRDGGRPIPVDTEPLALHRYGEEEHVLASGQPIARLRRPVVGDPLGDETFGFELEVSPPADAPADELSMRSLAYVVYRALRKSGVKWAIWARDPRRAGHGRGERDDGAHVEAADATTEPIAPSALASRRSCGRFDRGVETLGLIAALVIALVVALVVVPAVPTAAAVAVAVAALGALVLVGIIEVPVPSPEHWTRRMVRPVGSSEPPRATVATPGGAEEGVV